MMRPSFLFVVGIILLIFLSACTEEQEIAQEQEVVSEVLVPSSFITFEAGASESQVVLQTFEVSAHRNDLFAKWQAYNEQKIMQDKWDALIAHDDESSDRSFNDTTENESISQRKRIRDSPLNLSCQYMFCG